jgi:hypothetical protein
MTIDDAFGRRDFVEGDPVLISRGHRGRA